MRRVIRVRLLSDCSRDFKDEFRLITFRRWLRLRGGIIKVCDTYTLGVPGDVVDELGLCDDDFVVDERDFDSVVDTEILNLCTSVS